ncbi:hypothetical protein CAL7716_094070 [Calothrix sp. PCC 7716]|nr:hypothetical protein CAL7716_094070 [Calothrix sp. PCC 7716]
MVLNLLKNKVYVDEDNTNAQARMPVPQEFLFVTMYYIVSILDLFNSTS